MDQKVKAIWLQNQLQGSLGYMRQCLKKNTIIILKKKSFERERGGGLSKCSPMNSVIERKDKQDRPCQKAQNSAGSCSFFSAEGQTPVFTHAGPISLP